MKASILIVVGYISIGGYCALSCTILTINRVTMCECVRIQGALLILLLMATDELNHRGITMLAMRAVSAATITKPRVVLIGRTLWALNGIYIYIYRYFQQSYSRLTDQRDQTCSV